MIRKRGPRIKNRTRYSSRMIRQLLTRSHRLISKTEGPLQSWSWLVVEVDAARRSGRGDGCGGHATLSGGHMHLFLRYNRSTVKRDDQGHPVDHPDALQRRQAGRSGFVRVVEQEPVRTRDVAWLIYHELHHNYGFKHGRFGDATPRDLDRICMELPEFLSIKKDPVRLRKPLAVIRSAKADAMLTYWQRRLKTAQRKVREYAQRARYYQRVRAEKVAAGPVGDAPAPGQTTLLPEGGRDGE